MIKSKSPCVSDCPNRSIEPNCHNIDICEKWKEYVEKAEKERKIINERRGQEQEDYYLNKRRASSIKRSRRRHP